DRPEGMTGLVPPKPPVWDVRTPEYTVFEGVLPFVWETTRGLGRSFGYNRAETEADLLSVDDITAMLAQAASYNGNVLLNVGPRGDAQIDPPQADRLRQVGDWLATRSAAVQNTRPIEMPPQDVRVGAVENGDRCFLILLEKPSAKQAVIQLPSRLAGYANARAIARTDYQVSIDAGKLTVSPTASWGEGPVVISLSV
ncbi:MAG: alpha-L-fucosidase, partial [Pseudomonadota bacterium]